jgi:myo-inositol-1-phosphate synthase
LLKTALAPAFQVRQLRVDGWFSTNILGNNDGKVLDDPQSNKTKVASKLSVLDEILGYEVTDHQVHINYYRPRGDEKEAWDNIDVAGFLGQRMQIKINFLCRDSILAAPLVVDLVRLIDVAHRSGERGIRIPIPYRLAYSVVRLAFATVFKRNLKLPQVLIPCRFESRLKPLHYTNRHARELLGWRPPLDFDECLSRTFGRAP